MNEWISVKDRLPKIGLKVLITNKIFIDMGWIINDEHKYFGTPQGVCMDATHWFELPEMPK